MTNYLDLVSAAKKGFAQCIRIERSLDKRRIIDTIAMCGDRWDVMATPEQIVSALDMAGFKIVRKQRRREVMTNEN